MMIIAVRWTVTLPKIAGFESMDYIVFHLAFHFARLLAL